MYILCVHIYTHVCIYVCVCTSYTHVANFKVLLGVHYYCLLASHQLILKFFSVPDVRIPATPEWRCQGESPGCMASKVNQVSCCC